MRKLILADGREREFESPQRMQAICRLIGADVTDSVWLKSMGEPRQVMILDDQGIERHRPKNAKASELYKAQLRPDVPEERAVIYGDVFVCPDEDFA